jgi:GH15 family glucan-1,4-alpha-glucosidase
VSVYAPIGDYGVIGNCRTAALVGRDGAIDWYCPARFDAPAVFCRLLDAAKGGYLRVAPVGGAAVERRYVGATNILETVLAGEGGRLRLTDFMPAGASAATRAGGDRGGPARLWRRLEALGGPIEVEVAFKPTFDYARRPAAFEPAPDGAVARADGASLALDCRGLTLARAGDGALRGRLCLAAGERRWLALTDFVGEALPEAALAPGDGDAELERTLAYWEGWAGACTYRGPYRAEVLRSALALKLLTYEPTGAIIAAPTTSLPEEVGGVRNWDYRYAWLRDSSLILYALVTLGFRQEEVDYLRWLERASAGGPAQLPQSAYTLDGGRDLPEVLLDHLDGYRGSRPVRIGNAAAGQRQLDVFGEVLSAAYIRFRRDRRRAPAAAGEPLPSGGWEILAAFVEEAARTWTEPDSGIWEMRGGPQPFLYSRLMCWVALDCGLRLAAEHGLPAPHARWRRTRAEIRRAILRDGYNAERGAFTQAFGSAALDASALAIPRVGFLPATDPRVRSTVEAIRRELTHQGLVYRYRAADGLPGGEATFALCTFWLVDALALGDRLDEAHDLFEHVAGYANYLGLLSEEIDPATGELLGNFPQGFSHLALIRSAANLAKAAKYGAEARSENEGERVRKARHAAAEGHSARRIP